MNAGDIIPAYLQLPDYDDTKFTSAVIRDAANALVANLPLSLISNGFYANNSELFPDGTGFVTVQKLVFDDSGRTILSTSEGGSVELIQLSAYPQASQIVPLYAQLASYDTGKFVRAIVRDQNGSIVATVNLSHIADGLYGDNSSVTYPVDSAWLEVQYLVFDDSGYTILSVTQGAGVSAVFLKPAPSSALPADTGLVGVLDSTLQNPINGLQDTLVTNSDRILNARIVRSDNGDPFDLTGFTNVQFRFLNADESVLVVQFTDPGPPVEVTSAQAGKVSCSLTKEQTALLKPMNPAPFSVVIELPGGQSVCNFPYQLEVQAEVNPA